jgi:hypothetical protein
MFKKLKNFFHNPEKETIQIFEEKTRINYDSTLFSSLEVLSLSNSQLEYLPPLAVFINLEILNLSDNNIQDISSLKSLKKLRIIDLRFNHIKTLPLWVFKLNKTIYWERDNDEKEGIFLEGNPLDKKLISKIKNYPKERRLVPLIIDKKEKKPIASPKIEQLIALKRQAITLFVPESFSSNFIKIFTIPKKTSTKNNELQLNISTLYYSESSKIKQMPIQELHYIILILNETECCLNPPILELLSKHYSNSKIFLIIENSQSENIQEKITFFKTYNKSINIIEIYHSFDKKSNERIKEEIYNYLEKTQEPNSLWKKDWIALRDEIEIQKESNISPKQFQVLAETYHLNPEIRDDIFIYLQKVGSIK